MSLYRYVKNHVFLLDPRGHSVYKSSDTYADCVRKCEDDCYRQYVEGWYWYPGMWASFTGCANGCKSGCDNEDFTFCSYLNHWDDCYKDKLTCLCDAIEVADLLMDLATIAAPVLGSIGAVISALDCSCDVVTAMQYSCSRPQNEKNVLAIVGAPFLSCVGTFIQGIDPDWARNPPFSKTKNPMPLDEFYSNISNLIDVISSGIEAKGRNGEGDTPLATCFSCACDK
jgi:hypothetical protein